MAWRTRIYNLNKTLLPPPHWIVSFRPHSSHTEEASQRTSLSASSRRLCENIPLAQLWQVILLLGAMAPLLCCEGSSSKSALQLFTLELKQIALCLSRGHRGVVGFGTGTEFLMRNCRLFYCLNYRKICQNVASVYMKSSCNNLDIKLWRLAICEYDKCF